ALNLLCPDANDKIAQRARLGPTPPLVRHGLMHLLADADRPQPPLLAHFLKLDDQVVRLLLESPQLDPRLASVAQLFEPSVSLDDVIPAAPLREGLARVA